MQATFNSGASLFGIDDWLSKALGQAVARRRRPGSMKMETRRLHQHGKGIIEPRSHAESGKPLSDIGMKAFRRVDVA